MKYSFQSDIDHVAELVQLEEREILLRALQGLKQTYREAIILHYLDGYSPKESASLLGISYVAFRSRLSRGIAQLRGKISATTWS